MTTLTVRSYAKLNIALDVLDKRPDGYHNIESVIQSISLHDVLTVAVSDGQGISVKTSDPGLPCGEGNLAHRAAVVFLGAARLQRRVEIEIVKNVPAEAGLGGGSGDAAAVLMAMNEMTGRPLTLAELSGLAARLGSDVPFFLSGGTAFVSGRGEMVSDLSDCLLDYLIVKPDFGISTGWAYSQLPPERARLYAARRVGEAICDDDRQKVIRAMSNDFHPVAEKGFAEIGEIRERLVRAGADHAMLAGSGSAVFGAFLDPSACDRAFETIRSEYTRAYRAKSVSRSDVHAREAAVGKG